jgi:rRNA-processing protein FCF1
VLLESAGQFDCILLDSNLLTLFVVGKVNPARISSFKRTRKYDEAAFQFLESFLAQSKTVATTAHILTETSNLTDLEGDERDKARAALREFIEARNEVQVTGRDAANPASFRRLGLTDAAIHLAAAAPRTLVLTDDLDLYASLTKAGLQAINFSYELAALF